MACRGQLGTETQLPRNPMTFSDPDSALDANTSNLNANRHLMDSAAHSGFHD